MQGLLIGGTSHCGKSTLAKTVGGKLDWPVQSTDQLGRHPGRPWLGIPEPVAEFLDTLSDDTIYWFLRVHHDNMWPLLTQTIETAMASRNGFVLEGSALRPERLATLGHDEVVGLCLCADADFLVDRIRRESEYEGRDDRMRKLIDTFIARSVRDNEQNIEAARQHDIWLVDVSDATALSEATALILERASH